MILLDLFAGIGGFSLAAHWMGWETAAFVEKEAFCQKILRKNFGEGIEIHDDIFNFTGKPFRGRVDIVTGGFPCQPFSAAGKRKGRHDERHLFPEMLRVVREVKPRWVVAENVRGLLSIESGRVFAEVIASLESEGFEVVTFCVPASAVEAPHRRDRLWIVAHAKDVLFERNTGAVSGSHEPQHETKRPHERVGSPGNADRDAAYSASLRRDEGRAESEGLVGSPTPFDADRFAYDPECPGWPRCTCRTSPVKNLIRPKDGLSQPTDSNAAHATEPGLSITRLTRIGQFQEEAGERIHDRSEQPHLDAHHANGGRLPRRRGAGSREVGRGGQGRAAAGNDRATAKSPDTVRDIGWDEPWPEAAARLCRMDDGISDRVHRLKALGNSIVPQIAFEIFRAIDAAERRQGL